MCGCVCVCVGVFVDVFSQVSDSGGVLVQSKFDGFLREALKLPTALHEGPSFGYTHTLARSCFPQHVRSNTSSVRSTVFSSTTQFIYPGLVKLNVNLVSWRILSFVAVVSVEEGDAQHVPGYCSWSSSVSCVAASHAPHGQRGEWYTHLHTADLHINKLACQFYWLIFTWTPVNCSNTCFCILKFYIHSPVSKIFFFFMFYHQNIYIYYIY